MSKKKQTDEVLRLKQEEERQKLLADERLRNIKLIQDEARERALRKAIIDDTIVIFEDLLKKVRRHKNAIKTEEAWKKYLKCDHIPNTKIPSETRNFLFQFYYEFLEYHHEQINWWLKCDKNSIMTQDIRIPDTRRRTVDQHRVPTGKFYDQKFRFMMKVYENLQDTLRRKKVSKTHLEDLITVQSLFREKAFHFLDALTFEILMSIDREMVSLNPIVANYTYVSPDFIKFIWSFKDVTLPKDRNTEKYLKIQIQPLKMEVTLSNVFGFETTAVRILWIKRDFFSDLCPSFMPPGFEMNFESFDEAIEKEKEMRKFLWDKQIATMRKEREAYDALMEKKREQEEAEANKKSKKPEGSDKKKPRQRVIIEPPKVDEATYVDVEEEYLKYENQKVEEQMQKISPESLYLDDYDLNMREYEVINGNYKIECIERPIQDNEIYQHMFVRINERPHILKYKPFQREYVEPVMKNLTEERKSVFAAKILEAKMGSLQALIKVQIKLSDKIIWWEPPIACRWEPWEESEEFLGLSPEMQDYNVNFEKYQEKEQKKLWKISNTNYSKTIKVRDVKFSSELEDSDIKLSQLVMFYLDPVMSADYLCYVDKLEAFERKQRNWRYFKALKDMNHLFSDGESIQEIKNTVELLDTFLLEFNTKNFKPRNFYPVKLKGKLEVIENPELKAAVQKARQEIQKVISKETEYLPEFDDEIPIEDEPLTLSELLERLEELHKNLKPIFRPPDQIPPKKVKLKLERSTKRFKSKMVSQILTDKRKTNADLEKLRKSKVMSAKLEEVPIAPVITTEAIPVEIEIETEPELYIIPHHKGKWVRSNIYEESYDEKTKTYTFYTGRDGAFGLAIKKYLNFPFKHWELYPIHDDPADKHVLMKIEAQRISIVFKITAKGYTFTILKPGKTPMQQLRKNLKIFDLKKLLKSLNIHLFPEIDAGWYIRDISEKHTAMEYHTYKSMASFCLSHHFQSHVLNRYGSRRQILIKSKLYEKHDFVDILVTPMKVLTVDASLEEGDEGEDQLMVPQNPLEQEFLPDLLNYLKSEVDKAEHRLNQRCFMVLWNTQALLMNLRPLSFTQ